MAGLFADIFSSVYFLIFAYIVAGVFAISGTDDLLFDLIYLKWRIRRLLYWHVIKEFNSESLAVHQEHRIAIFVPCWHESSVIGRMVKRAADSLEYKNYMLIVGVYPNDSATIRAVSKLVKQYPKLVRMVINPKSGPTTKADNLNSMWSALRRIEGKKRFRIVVLHDGEDIIHPHSLRVFNYLICYLGKDMVQLPVLPWEQPAWDMVHWTYADEFAENHLRHMVAREEVGSFVPSAGVGTAYRRESLEILEHHHQRVFHPDSLTEDYSSALELHHRGHGTIFAVIRDCDGKVVATRSLFPRTVGAAIRQKTRWIIGIALQGWAHHGWHGCWRTKYVLFRDRKQVLVGFTNLAGYILLAMLMAPRILHLDAAFVVPDPLWYLFIIDTSMFVLRLVMRMSAVWTFYSFKHSLLVIVRYLLANYINFVASERATYKFFKLYNQPIPWDKTAHEFPRTL